MAKCRVLFLCAAFAASVTLSMAQGTQVRSSSASAKPGPDSLQNVTKPLTPKSAMPPQHNSAPVMPMPSEASRTNAELVHLERQPIKASTSGSAKAKGAPLVKSANASAGNGSGINFKYQKPVGGTQATVPNAQAPNSSTPRVKKN
jgi:hypothetical protein